MHVEIEREWRSDIDHRLFEYASAAVVSPRSAICSIVILLRPGGRPPEGVGEYRVPDLEGDTFVFRYHIVPLWRLDAREMREQLGLEGAPFCVAMRGADETFVRELVEDVRSDHRLSERDRQTTMQLLYVVSAAILGSDTARRIFHVESIIQDPNVQELINEWEGKGRTKGRAEGHAEGRAEGARLLLHKVLEARAFPVPPEVHARIAIESDLDRLESWLEAAVTAPSLNDVFQDH